MMTEPFKSCLWKNFSGALDMFAHAIQCCPDILWEKYTRFYFLAYHTTIFLDYYLTSPVRNFRPALPYALIDPADLPPGAVDDVMPSRPYNRQELSDALQILRSKCRDLVMGSSEEVLQQRWIQPDEVDLHGLCPTLVEEYTLLEILFYNLRHVQHHTGQMNLILRQEIHMAPDWISWGDE